MSFHFIGLLTRRGARTPVAGIDLDGFVQEVDQAVRATRALERSTHAGPRSSSMMPFDSSLDQEARLARAATIAFFEHLAASGPSRPRLHQLWRLLRQEVAQSSSMLLSRLIERHVVAAYELCEQLGKLVDIGEDTRGLCVTRRVADALDVGLLHSIRNAVDHGLELPQQRLAAGKPPRGAIRVTAIMDGDVVEIAVEDDGRGFDHAAIVERAFEAGLLDESARQGASSVDAQELLFCPGFSTAGRTTRVSGRGVGLDAVRAALGKVGGQVSAHARTGGGARIVMRVPVLVHHVQVHIFEARPGILLAIPATWTVTLRSEPSSVVVDPLEALGIAERATIPGKHVLMLRRGLLHAHYAAASLPRLVNAQRICPTIASDPMEVVVVQGQEVLVLRPDQLSGAAAADARRSMERAT
jgi:chemotaxis protein histidine kinase CheA